MDLTLFGYTQASPVYDGPMHKILIIGLFPIYLINKLDLLFEYPSPVISKAIDD